ncbi:MAG TPA: YfiR family protein, partial [Lacibacter sp.]|nr:YfiR family protein [Lacibacter sp.]
AQQALISITHINKVENTTGCSVVIIHRDQEKNLSALLQFLQNKNVLTISDIAQFAQRGGMVEMSKEDEKINLYINKNAVNHAGLNIQEPMLKLAKIVAS